MLSSLLSFLILMRLVEYSVKQKVVESVIHTIQMYDWVLMIVIWGQGKEDSNGKLENLVAR